MEIKREEIVKLQETIIENNEKALPGVKNYKYTVAFGKNNVFGVFPSVDEIKSKELFGQSEQAHKRYKTVLTAGHTNPVDAIRSYDGGIQYNSFEEMVQAISELTGLTNIEILEKFKKMELYSLHRQDQLKGLIAFDKCLFKLKESGKIIRFMSDKMMHNLRLWEDGKDSFDCLDIRSENGKLRINDIGENLTSKQIEEIEKATEQKFEELIENHRKKGEKPYHGEI